MATNSSDNEDDEGGNQLNCFLANHGTKFKPLSLLSENLGYPLLVSGVLLNAITIIATYRKAKKNSCHYYMMMVAWADLYVIVSGQVIKIIEEFKSRYSRAECRLIGFHEVFPPQFAILLLVFMTFDRYLAITQPLRSNRLCTVRRGIITTATVAGVLLLLNVATIFVFGDKEHEGRINCMVTSRPPWRVIFEVSNRIISQYLPFLALLFLNIAIARTVCSAVQRQAVLTHGQNPRQEATRKITIMVVIVSFAFLILVFPTGIAFLMMLRYDTWQQALVVAIGNCTAYNDSMVFLYFIGTVLYPFNHVINGLIYLITSSQFRRDLIRNVTCCRRRMPHAYNGRPGVMLSTVSATSATSLTYTAATTPE